MLSGKKNWLQKLFLHKIISVWTDNIFMCFKLILRQSYCSKDDTETSHVNCSCDAHIVGKRNPFQYIAVEITLTILKICVCLLFSGFEYLANEYTGICLQTWLTLKVSVLHCCDGFAFGNQTQYIQSVLHYWNLPQLQILTKSQVLYKY